MNEKLVIYFVFWKYQTLICGLLGLPPSNGVLPQSPMHTRSLAVLRRQVILVLDFSITRVLYVVSELIFCLIIFS